MAMMAFASSLTVQSTWTQKPMFNTNSNKSPLLGLSRSSTTFIPKASTKSKSHAELWEEFKKSRKEVIHIPVDQRWMFTLEEAVGPVIFFLLLLPI